MTLRYKKCLVALLLFLISAPCLLAQPGAGYRPTYQFLHSGNLVADKNFYWLTVIDQSPAVQQLLAGDPTLLAVNQRRVAILKTHVEDTCSWAGSLLVDFTFTHAQRRPPPPCLGTDRGWHQLHHRSVRIR